jgi:hypothetical protein
MIRLNNINNIEYDKIPATTATSEINEKELIKWQRQWERSFMSFLLPSGGTEITNENTRYTSLPLLSPDMGKRNTTYTGLK